MLRGQYFKLRFDRPIGKEMPDEKIDDVVWAEIDGAFSEPVTKNDDTDAYAPTQTLAELFRHEGYDGITYKSAFGDDAYSVALFDLESAEQFDGQLYETEKVDFTFETIGNPYYVTPKRPGAM